MRYCAYVGSGYRRSREIAMGSSAKDAGKVKFSMFGFLVASGEVVRW